jgi:endonuclease/exonuclease/phosphatase family metal-dependent hydrolase
VKICTYNILDGGVGRIDPLAEVIRLSGAEVVVVQECADARLFRKLAERLGMDFFLAENPRNSAGEGATGVLVKIGWGEIREAVNYAPLDPRLTRSAFHVVIRENAASGIAKPEEWTVMGLHLHARETLADEEVRLSELPAVLEIGQRLKDRGRDVLMCGDFNTSHPDQVIDPAKLRPKVRERIAGQGGVLPREVIRRVLAADAGWLDAHALGKAPQEFGVSFTTAAPAMRVDYVFVTPGLLPRVKSCEVFRPEMARFASDHFPVVAEIAARA